MENTNDICLGIKMSLPKLFIVGSLLLFANIIKAQQPIIKNIKLEGLKRTSESYLLTFINSKVGNHYQETLALADVQNLKNVIGVGRVTHRIDTLGEQINLVFDITEIRTLLPIINFGGIEGNVWFQLGFYDANWKGKGHFLSASYQNIDQRHSGKIFYRVPRIGQSNWGFSGNLNSWASREPLFFSEGVVNYDYNLMGIGISAIRHFGRQHNIEFGGTYFVEEYQKSALQTLINTPGPEALTQPKLLTKWEYRADYLNYHFFYLQGLIWRTTLQNVFNTIDNSLFNSLQIQGRYFHRLGNKGNLAFRLRLGIATNNNTPFAPFVADSQVNLRGVGNRIDRGTAQVILNAEYRQALVETSKWGFQVVAFSDLGTWRNPGGELKDLLNPDQFRHFIGGGIRLIYQKFYGAVLRIDYGVDVFNKQQRGLVIGLGQYF